MNYWLMKSEPDVWSIEQQKKAGKKGAAWDGVRNYQAANNLKAMKKGDLCFFYHSNIGKEIVGIVKVIKEAFIDKTDKEKRLKFLFGQKENLKQIKHKLLVSQHQNLEEYIDKLMRMVTNNRESDMIKKHHKIESNLDKFM